MHSSRRRALAAHPGRRDFAASHPLHALHPAGTSRCSGAGLQDQRSPSGSSALDTTPLPISELYYLGGINTVRGYVLRSICPTKRCRSDPRPPSPHRALPRRRQQAGHLQLRARVPHLREGRHPRRALLRRRQRLRRTTPSSRTQQVNLPLGLLHSVGFGFRWFSPIGPLRFEWGIPLEPAGRRRHDQPFLFEFTIGNFF